MSKNTTSALIVAVLLVLWLGSGAFVGDSTATPQSSSTTEVEDGLALEAAELSKVRVTVHRAEPRTRTIVLRGQTEAKRTVAVTAEIAGQVVSRPVAVSNTHLTLPTTCRVWTTRWGPEA